MRLPAVKSGGAPRPRNRVPWPQKGLQRPRESSVKHISAWTVDREREGWGLPSRPVTWGPFRRGSSRTPLDDRPWLRPLSGRRMAASGMKSLFRPHQVACAGPPWSEATESLTRVALDRRPDVDLDGVPYAKVFMSSEWHVYSPKVVSISSSFMRGFSALKPILRTQVSLPGGKLMLMSQTLPVVEWHIKVSDRGIDSRLCATFVFSTISAFSSFSFFHFV